MPILWIVVLIFAALLLAFCLGPRPRKPRLDATLPPPMPDAASAEARLQAHEASVPRPIRPDNQARIRWAGEPGQATERCILYLHGYSASWREGGPVHEATAARYGANLLLTRLQAHGLEGPEPMLDFDAEACWEDAKQALVLARALGQKVLLMATSSGAPLALRLAALYPERIEGLVLYSPNIRIRQPLAPLMAGPWGLQIARLVKGSRYNDFPTTGIEQNYWYSHQRLEGAVQLQQLLNGVFAGGVLGAVKQPTFMGTYYKDAAHQDDTVSVPAIRRAFAALGTSPVQKRYREFPDAGSHVIACDLSSGAWQAVQTQTWEFLEDVLGWVPKV